MKTVSVGYSKLKTGLALMALTYLAVLPIAIYLTIPNVFQFEGNSTSEVLLFCGVLLFCTATGLGFLAIKIKKLKSSKEAVLIYKDGIWSNVSGISEKFIPWSRVERAYTIKNHNTFALLVVEQKESQQENEARSKLSRFLRPKPTMAIWPITLERYSYNLVEIINDYASMHNGNGPSEEQAPPPAPHSLDASVKKAA